MRRTLVLPLALLLAAGIASSQTVATLRVTPQSADVPFRGTLALAAAVLDAVGAPLQGRAVAWQSSDPGVATVSPSGVVTGLLPGEVTITATSETAQAAARVLVVTSDLAPIVESVRREFNLPALGGAIVSRSGTVAMGVAGVRRWGTPTPVTPADKWHLGSNSKTMTALLAAITVKAGRLGWADLLTVRYPELAALARPEFAALDLADLATMRAGIVGNPNFAPTGTLAQQRSAVDRWAIGQLPVEPRGTYYYSNVAYQMLAEIVGRAWATGYEEAMRAQLWAPLGIASGGFGPTTAAGMTDQPAGHFPAGGGWTVCEACDNSWATGSGKIHMSLPDWARLAQEILRADAGQSALLSQSESRLLTTGATKISPSQDYGYGWVTFTNPAQRVVTHDGSNNRNRSRSTLYLDSGVGFLVTTNAGDPAANGGAPNAALTALVARLQAYWQTGR